MIILKYSFVCNVAPLEGKMAFKRGLLRYITVIRILGSYFVLAIGIVETIVFQILVSVKLFVFLDEAQQAEATQVLRAIFDVRERRSNEQPNNVAKIAHTLAMLYYVLQDVDKVTHSCVIVYLVHSDSICIMNTNINFRALSNCSCNI